MKLSRKSWNNYVSMLSAINKTAGRKMQAWIDIHGTNDIEALVEYAYALTTKYGEAASATACQMYDEIAELQKANVPPAMPKPTQNIKYVDKAVRSTLDRAPSMVSGTVSEMVKRTGAETTLKNAMRDGAYFAWVPNGDTCAFCITLASNGWRRASKKTINGDHAEHIHKNCDCEFAISFNGPGQIEGYDPDKYLAMYEGAEGSSWKDKVNSMRRAHYAANKDMINAQKRAAYARRAPREKMLRLAKQGNTFVVKTEDLFEYAKEIKPIDGFEDIVGHGDPFSMVFRDANGNESNVSAEEFADILEKGGIYKGGKIRLIACQTGAGDGIVPTYLAKKFNTIVMAPTEIVNVDLDGKMILANDEEDAKMGIETGEWVLFGPNGRIK